MVISCFAEDHHVPGEPLVSLPSVAWLSSPPGPDPRLCVPASRRVCLYREGVSAFSTLSGCDCQATRVPEGGAAGVRPENAFHTQGLGHLRGELALSRKGKKQA